MKPWIMASLIWVGAAPWLMFPQVAPSLTVAALLFLLATRLYLARRWGRIMLATLLNGFVLVYVLLVAGGFLLAPFPGEALPKLTTLFLGVCGYLLVLDGLWPPAGVEHRDKQWEPGSLSAGADWMCVGLALIGGGIALAAPFVVEWPQRQLLDIAPVVEWIPHLSGSFYAHSNEIAGTLLFLLPFALFTARQRGVSAVVRWQRPAGWLLLGVMLLVLLLMQSRAALLALVGLGFLTFLWGRWRLRWLAAGGLVGGLLLVLLWAANDVSPGQISTWVSQVDARSKQGAFAPQSWPMRQEIWSAAGQVLVDYPVFGLGLDSFVPVSRANYPFQTIYPDHDFAHAHNLWLQAGADTGWPGILAVTLLLGIPVAGLWQAARPGVGKERVLLLTFGTSLAGYLLFSLLDTIALQQRPGILLWLVLGGSAVLLKQSAVLDRRLGYAALAPLVLLVVLLFTPLAGRNWANGQLDRARLTGQDAPPLDSLTGQRRCLWQAHQGEWAAAEQCFAARPEAAALAQSQGLNAAYADDPAGALGWYALALALDDTSTTAYYWRGRFYEQQEAFSLAQADYEQAVWLASQQNLDATRQASILFRLGHVHVSQQDWTAARRYLLAAIELDETQPIYFEVLGDVLLTIGDEAGAAAAYQKAGKNE